MIRKITEINNELKNDRNGFIDRSDLEYERSIAKIAEDIASRADECPIILISGPSGSGKSTSAFVLEKYLDNMGHETHVLPLDDFFSTITDEQKLLMAQKKIDLESPERIDSPYLNNTLADIIACKPVKLPKFDFKESRRLTTDNVLHRKPGELVILEGIHALNPDVITVDGTVGIYVSVRTRLETADGSVIHPEYIRLLRRMLRDRIYRGRTFEKTAEMYESVQLGENKYIMPYKSRAAYDIDTFIPYEVNVYRDLIFEGIKSEGLEADLPQLIKLLLEAEPLSQDSVSSHSLIREFLGDGMFEY